MDAGRLSEFIFELFDNAGEEKSAVDAVLFGTMERSARKSKVADERAELIVEHAGKNNSGKCAGVEDDTFRGAGTVFFNGSEQKFKIERRVVGDERQVAAKVGESCEDGMYSGFIGDHIVGDAVDGGGFRRDRTSGIDQGAESSDRLVAAKTHGADFDNGVGSRLKAGGF